MTSTVSNKRTKRKRSEVGSSGNNEPYLQKERSLIGDSVTDIEKNVAKFFQGFDKRILNLEAKFQKVNRELKTVNRELKTVNRELKKVKAENRTLKSRIATLERRTPNPLNLPTIEENYENTEGSVQPSEGNVSMETAALPDDEDARFKCNYCYERQKDLLCFNCMNKSIEGAKNSFIESIITLPATQVKPKSVCHA